MRKEQKLTFKEIENTKEYAETHYYKVKFRHESSGLIDSNMLWKELAEHLLLTNG